MDVVTAALQPVARGMLHPTAAKALSASTLVTLPKADGGIRPIAIGEVLTRLVCRTVCLQKPCCSSEAPYVGASTTGSGPALPT